MARLDFPDYLEHIRSESRRFREVLSTCDPDARVPGCPEWNAADLLWHLAEDLGCKRRGSQFSPTSWG